MLLMGLQARAQPHFSSLGQGADEVARKADHLKMVINLKFVALEVLGS